MKPKDTVEKTNVVQIQSATKGRTKPPARKIPIVQESTATADDAEIEMDGAWARTERARRYLYKGDGTKALKALRDAVADLNESIAIIEGLVKEGALN